MMSPLQNCLYAVSLLLKRKDGVSAVYGDMISAASEEEALGVAVMAWQEKFQSTHPHFGGYIVTPVDYDQLAYIAAQFEE